MWFPCLVVCFFFLKEAGPPQSTLFPPTAPLPIVERGLGRKCKRKGGGGGGGPGPCLGGGGGGGGQVVREECALGVGWWSGADPPPPHGLSFWPKVTLVTVKGGMGKPWESFKKLVKIDILHLGGNKNRVNP